jgi:protein TonB
LMLRREGMRAAADVRQRTAAVLTVAALHVAALLAWAPSPPRDTPAMLAPPERTVVRVALAPAPEASPSPSLAQTHRLREPRPVVAPRASAHHAPEAPIVLAAPQPAAMQPASIAMDSSVQAQTQAPAGSAKLPTGAPGTVGASAAFIAAEAELPLSPADYLDSPPPAYPAASRRRGEQGRVMVSVLVSAEGLVKEAIVETSSGFPRLDEAALSAVRRWKFVPARRGGIAVDRRHLIPMNFVALPG